MSSPDVDVAIVGGGIGGIYSGWRLATATAPDGSPLHAALAGAKPRVAVFEASRRIGGRLLSARPPMLRGTTAELGGMRYVYPAQTRITHLVEDVLKLNYREQVVDLPGNIAFMRSVLLRTSQLGDPQVLPYRLDPGESAWLAARTGQSPASLIGRVLEQLMPGLAEASTTGKIREYLETVKIPFFPGGEAAELWQHGFWNLLARDMSSDGLAAAKATIGYDCLGGNGNALDLASEYFAFTPDVQYRMIVDGYERVPYELARQFEQNGGEIHYQHTLHSLDTEPMDDGQPGMRLVFADGKVVTARIVILAMPPRSLELLQSTGPIFGNTDFVASLNAVTPIPLFKLFLLYDQCWWQAAGVTAGRSLTDLPLRQCYYWPIGACGTAPASNKPGVIMAYDDLLNVSFWGGLDARQHTFDRRPKLNLFKRDQAPTPQKADDYEGRLILNWCEHAAGEPMVAEMHRQLLLMHGVDSAPPPCEAAYMDWSRDPYGGGVHLWNPGYESAVLVKSMTQPVAGLPCYLCGEAFSTDQTWAEGALETAELVLQDRLGLPDAQAAA